MESFEFLGGRYNRPEQIMSGPMQAFRAQNAATGRVVFIHRVSTTEAPQEQAFLLKLLTTALVKSNEAKRLVLDFGEERGYWYVVTESEPQCALLREWLQLEIDSALADSGKSPAVKGAVPLTPSTPPPAPMRTPEDSGEFTRFLQKTRTPFSQPPPTSARVDPPAMRVSPTPVAPSGVTPQPGEFTRTFQSEDKLSVPAAPPKSPDVAPPVSIPPPIQRPPAGEFTQLFNKLGSEPKETAPPATPRAHPPEPVAAPAAESTPEPPAATGEFTRFFSGGVPPSPPKPNPYVQRPTRAVPPAAPSPTPASSAPPTSPAGGEFTRFFSSDAPTDKPAAAPVVQRPTSRVPPPAATPPATTNEGEFTRMFARSPEPGRPLAPANDPFRSAQQGSSGFDQSADDIFGGGGRIDIPQPLPSPSRQSGEFTQLFGAGDTSPAVQRPSVVAAPKPVSPVSDQPFNPPAAPSAPPSQQGESGPSEFTRIMRGGPAPPTPGSPAGPTAPAAGSPASIPLPKVPLPTVSLAPPNPSAAMGHLGGGTGSAHASAGASGASASANSALGSAQVNAPAPALPRPSIPAAKLPATPPIAGNRKMIILFAVLALMAVLLVLLTLFLIKK